MPEPRETHAAIDARRNAQRGGGGDAHELALLLAQHQRLDAPGGKCSCGHETALGDLTSRHIADAILAAGWVPAERLANCVKSYAPSDPATDTGGEGHG